MSKEPEPAATGLRMLVDLALASGGEFTPDGTLWLPPNVGTGYIRLLAPEPGLKLTIHHCTLAREFTLKRVANEQQPETLLVSFHTFGQGPKGMPLRLSTAQLASSSFGFTTTLPADTAISIVAMAIDNKLLARWLPESEGLLPAFLSAGRPVVLDALLTAELQTVLSQVAEARPAHQLDAFFYKIKAQELLYWLLRELATRDSAPARRLHPADVERIYQVRTALLASLSTPPSLAGLAQAAGLSETKLKQLFRQVFGASPYTYYQTARMEEARQQLLHGSVAEVGYQLGFTNLSHFARLFEKHHGLTPKKYQAMHQR